MHFSFLRHPFQFRFALATFLGFLGFRFSFRFHTPTAHAILNARSPRQTELYTFNSLPVTHQEGVNKTRAVGIQRRQKVTGTF